MELSPEAVGVINDLNPWWDHPGVVRPVPPGYRRRRITEIASRLRGRGKLIEVLRGPRQVGKTTGIYQIIQDLMQFGVSPRNILICTLRPRGPARDPRRVAHHLPLVRRQYHATPAWLGS